LKMSRISEPNTKHEVSPRLQTFSKTMPLQVTRHFYTKNVLFEKSLDIYKPSYQDPDMPIVLLTVGSGWMGHRWFVYRLTSWWNSGGPKNIASLGTVCVCIRHRGAFMDGVPSLLEITPWIILISAIIAALTTSWHFGVATALLLVLFRFLLIIGNQGSAELEDMMSDVSEAIEWVKCNKHALVLENHDMNNLPKMIFGGYSSGGHVSATLMNKRYFWEKYGDIISGIIMISGVLAVKPVKVEMPFKSTTSSLSTVITSDDSFQSEGDCDEHQTNPSFLMDFGNDKPRWLTDKIMSIVWGEDQYKIPSPIDNLHPPKVPRLLVGNHKEMFGLNWLDIFFCSKEYHRRLIQKGIPSVYREVSSDHWNILASNELKEALREELPKLVKATFTVDDSDSS